jgi:BirA family biotin operon repressor/biotin-[acetyl-CoA-carboxylase] ligase
MTDLTPIGHIMLELDSIGSTNNYAMHLLEEQRVEEGTVVITNFQSKGRGQDDNHWFSDRGLNLLFSVILYPGFLPASEQFIINKLLSLAILDFIRHMDKSKSTLIKWPNDIYIGNKKVAGILVQNSIQGNHIEHTIAGIGININQERFPDFDPPATSLKLEFGKTLQLKNSRSILFKKIALRYHQLKSGARDTIHWDYLHALYRFNSWHEYKAGKRVFIARIIGVNEFGKLVLEEKNGNDMQYDIRGIRFLPDQP